MEDSVQGHPVCPVVYNGLFRGGIGRGRWDGSARENVGFGHGSVAEGQGLCMWTGRELVRRR